MLAIVTVALSSSAMVLVAEPEAVIKALSVAGVRVTVTVSSPSTRLSSIGAMAMSWVSVLAGITTEVPIEV